MPTVIFKPTEQCNARCTYCDVVKQSELKTMDVGMLELVLTRMNDYLMEFPEKEFEFVWHGGEPLLLSDEFFETAIRCMETTCAQTRSRIRHCIQTNLTMIQPKHIDFFKRLDIHSIGTSFEPIPGIRGIGKKINSELYNERFFHGISLLESHDISWGFIYVVTKKSLEDPEGLWYTLTNLKPDGGFMMNAVLLYDNEDDGIGITPMEYVDFLGRLFPLWWKHRDRWPLVDPFSSLLHNVQGSNDLGCVDSGGCGYAHVYIGPVGQASQCGRSADWGLIDYGNIKDRSLREIMEDPKREMFFERQDYLMHNDCKGCRFWKVCHGGCALDAWDAEEKNHMRKTHWCSLRSVFIEKYFEPVTGLKFNAYADADN
jgi:uncharacterized protein